MFVSDLLSLVKANLISNLKDGEMIMFSELEDWTYTNNLMERTGKQQQTVFRSSNRMNGPRHDKMHKVNENKQNSFCARNTHRTTIEVKSSYQLGYLQVKMKHFLASQDSQKYVIEELFHPDLSKRLLLLFKVILRKGHKI